MVPNHMTVNIFHAPVPALVTAITPGSTHGLKQLGA
jgi:hypothetical protein